MPERDPTVKIHDGFMLRVGLGYANLYSRGHAADRQLQGGNLTGPTPPSQTPMRGLTAGGLAMHADIGYAPKPGLVLGAEISSHAFASLSVNGQSRSDFDPYSYCFEACGIKYVGLGAFILIYPDPRGGLSSGLVASMLSAHDDNPYRDSAPTGFALAPQLGYEWWIGDDGSFGVFARVTFARLSSDESGYYGGRGLGETANVALTSVGLTVTYQ